MKKDKIIYWTVTGIIFLFEGMMPLLTLLLAAEYITAGTKPLGYPDYFAYALLVFKLLGTIALVFPKMPNRIKEWAYAGLTFNLLFATISHIAVDGWVGVSFFPLVIMAILAVSYSYNQKIQKDSKDSAKKN